MTVLISAAISGNKEPIGKRSRGLVKFARSVSILPLKDIDEMINPMIFKCPLDRPGRSAQVQLTGSQIALAVKIPWAIPVPIAFEMPCKVLVVALTACIPVDIITPRSYTLDVIKAGKP